MIISISVMIMPGPMISMYSFIETNQDHFKHCIRTATKTYELNIAFCSSGNGLKQLGIYARMCS